MNYRNLKAITITLLSLSTFITILTIVFASNQKIDLGLIYFILWGVSPYVCLFLIDLLFRKIGRSQKTYLFSCLASVLMFCLTVTAYVGISRDRSSTAGLAFVFIPPWLNLGALLLFVVNLIATLLSYCHATVKTAERHKQVNFVCGIEISALAHTRASAVCLNHSTNFGIPSSIFVVGL